MNSNFFIGVVLTITLGAMMFAMGYMANENIKKMEKQNSMRSMSVLIQNN